MQKFFNKLWLTLGSLLVILSAGTLIIVVYIAKFLNKALPNKFKDKLFLNSKAHPLPPAMEKN